MALNIKAYYPFDHPRSEFSVTELITHISKPISAKTFLETEVKREEVFGQYEDMYFNKFKPKWREEDHDINEKAYKLLDVI